MKFDRRLQFGIVGEPTFEDGTPVAAEIAVVPIWAHQSDYTWKRDPTESVTEGENRRRWMIRWRADFAAAVREQRLLVRPEPPDETDAPWYWVAAVEERGRRRYLEVTTEWVLA